MLPRRLRRTTLWPTKPELLFVAVLACALAVRLGWVAATPHFVPLHDAHDFDRYGISIARFGRFPHASRIERPTSHRPHDPPSRVQ